jgi:uncharacterized membrane protein YpjA
LYGKMSISLFWSRSFLTSRSILWTLFWINLLGTIYGYEWYWRQLAATASEKPVWMLPFVPDSPTASLFFTVAVAWFLYDRSESVPRNRTAVSIRSLIEALASVTSIKYGIWAVAMIAAGAYQGNPLAWQDWMLIASHTAMAVQVLLYARFFGFSLLHIAIAGIWTLTNDFVDYGFGVFPWLPQELYDDLPAIANFTIGLSLLSILTTYGAMKWSRRR